MLTEKDYQDAAAALQVDVPAVKAITAVESSGGGFLPSGRPKILFEGHIFHRLTGGKFDSSHPSLSYRKWTKAYYKGGEGEHQRFDAACALDRHAAIQATSFGLFQILGSNYAACGFNSPEAYYEAMCKDEAAQLQAFVAFCKANHLDDPLRAHDWMGFARHYNGPGYAANKYDVRLKAAWLKAGGK